jgi:alpha-beta hydrolase superfamily lysophospholipase
MSQLRSVHVRARSGSIISMHEVGAGDRVVFVIGGLSVRSFAESAMRLVLEDAADGGTRCVLMDIAGSGASTSGATMTMDSWLDDIDDVFQERVAGPAIWTGASIGAWLMLLAHRRDSRRFVSMCALAPALDWDQQYVGPRLADGRLGAIEGIVVNADATALASRELLVSMAPHHLLHAPFALGAPLHVIAGMRDEIAPPAGARKFIENARGAACTGEFLPEGDHGTAKLDPPLAMLRYQAWLRAALSAPSPAGPGSAR